MAVKSVGYGPSAANTERGPSEAIWGSPGAPNGWVEDFIQSPRLGNYFFDDFLDTGGALTLAAAGQYGKWTTYAEATRPTLTDDAILGGGLKMAASTTAHDGVSLSTNCGAFQIVNSTPTLQGKLAFEARVKLSSIAASTIDLFVGLMDTLPTVSVVPITATGGALSTTPGFLGFHARGGATNPGDFSVAFNVAGGTVQYPTGLTNLVNTVQGSAYVAATYVKLGFVFDPTASIGTQQCITAATSNQTAGNLYRPMLRFYVNGQVCATFLIKTDITGATFPILPMGPVIAFKQQSTTASISAAIDWIRVAQMALV